MLEGNPIPEGAAPSTKTKEPILQGHLGQEGPRAGALDPVVKLPVERAQAEQDREERPLPGVLDPGVKPPVERAQAERDREERPLPEALDPVERPPVEAEARIPN